MTTPVVMKKVKSHKQQWFVTKNDPETRLQDHTNYDECKLECGHYEYRRVSGGGEPKMLACRTCTGRKLTASERKRRAA